MSVHYHPPLWYWQGNTAFDYAKCHFELERKGMWDAVRILEKHFKVPHNYPVTRQEHDEYMYWEEVLRD